MRRFLNSAFWIGILLLAVGCADREGTQSAPAVEPDSSSIGVFISKSVADESSSDSRGSSANEVGVQAQPDVQPKWPVVPCTEFFGFSYQATLDIHGGKPPPPDAFRTRFLQEAEAQDEAIDGISDSERRALSAPVLPMVLATYLPVFSKAELDETDLEACKVIGDAVAFATGDETLRIGTGSEDEAKDGLARVGDWFNRALDDDKLVNWMIFTMNDGPFFGEPIGGSELAGGIEVDRVDLPKGAGTIILLQSKSEGDPIVFVRADADGTETRRTRLVSDGTLRVVDFDDSTLEDLGGRGFWVRARCEWSGGSESGDFYLRPNGDLRFFYLSW